VERIVRNHGATANGLAMDVVELTSVPLGSNPHRYKGKLAEREESTDLWRVLFHNGFFKASNIRTIRITLEKLT
jgi:hypothetical protein